MACSPGLSRADGLLRLLRFVGLRFGNQIIGQPRIGIETDNAFRVGDKIRQRVDVVVEKPSIAIVDDVFDSADFNARFVHDAFHILNHLARRSVAFHLEAIFWSVDRARGADQFLSPCALANIRRAKIESIAGGVNLDGVEKLAAKYFETTNHPVPPGEKFPTPPHPTHPPTNLTFFTPT